MYRRSTLHKVVAMLLLDLLVFQALPPAPPLRAQEPLPLAAGVATPAARGSPRPRPIRPRGRRGAADASVRRDVPGRRGRSRGARGVRGVRRQRDGEPAAPHSLAGLAERDLCRRRRAGERGRDPARQPLRRARSRSTASPSTCSAPTRSSRSGGISPSRPGAPPSSPRPLPATSTPAPIRSSPAAARSLRRDADAEDHRHRRRRLRLVPRYRARARHRRLRRLVPRQRVAAVAGDRHQRRRGAGRPAVAGSVPGLRRRRLAGDAARASPGPQRRAAGERDRRFPGGQRPQRRPDRRGRDRRPGRRPLHLHRAPRRERTSSAPRWRTPAAPPWRRTTSR